MKATSYNRFNQRFDVVLKGMDFVKLEDLYQKQPSAIYQLTGLFINTKSRYGDRPYASTKDFLVDLPKHMLNTVIDMIGDSEVVDEINKGMVGIKVTTYYSKTYNRQCYNVEFVTYNK